MIVTLNFIQAICANFSIDITQVVNALNRIVEGSTCGIIIQGCSPARLESSYTSESAETEGSLHCASLETVKEGSSSVGSTSISSMSQMILRLPPTPPMGNTSSSGSSTFKLYDEFTFDTRAINQRDKGISQNEDGLVYVEMDLAPLEYKMYFRR